VLFGSAVWVSWSRDSITLKHHWPLAGSIQCCSITFGSINTAGQLSVLYLPFSHSPGSSSRNIITSESPPGQSSSGQLFILCLSGIFNILGAVSSYSLGPLGLPPLHVRNLVKAHTVSVLLHHTESDFSKPSRLVDWVCLFGARLGLS
jgi:hypothetical protein